MLRLFSLQSFNVFLFREREIFDEEILERKKWKAELAAADSV